MPPASLSSSQRGALTFLQDGLERKFQLWAPLEGVHATHAIHMHTNVLLGDELMKVVLKPCHCLDLWEREIRRYHHLLWSYHYWAGAVLSEITFLFTISNPFHPRKMYLHVFAPVKLCLCIAGSQDYVVHQLSQLIYHASVRAAVWFNHLIKTVLIDLYSLSPTCSGLSKSFSWVRRRQGIKSHFSICLLKKKSGPEKTQEPCLYLSAENQPQTYRLLCD